MNLPEPFLERIQISLGEDTESFLSAVQEPASLSFRVNSLKFQDGKHEQDFPFESVPWAEDGYYLPERPLFTCDPLLHAGCYYVQEASSMLLEQAVQWMKRHSDVEKFLDLCAAPGGKTTHLISLVDDNALIVSNEVINSRARILAENITKWSAANTVVTNNDPAHFGTLGEFFDVMLVDAPCSGEGLFRKDSESINQWSLSNLQLCAERQKRILNDALPALTVGGYLIYCTCTFNPAENEEIVQWLIETENYQLVDLEIESRWGFQEIEIEAGKAYQAYPHKVRGEGFFLAVLQKTQPSQGSPRRTASKQQKRRKKKKSQRCAPCQDVTSPQVSNTYEITTRKITRPFQDWLNVDQRLRFLNKGEHVVAIPQSHVEDVLQIQEHLKIVALGGSVCELKKHGSTPAHGLALSPLLNRECFAGIDVEWETALRYLKREPIETSLPDGIGFISYKNHPLGWVKQIGPRCNNWYPKEWRIRMSIPETKPWSVLEK